MKRQEKEPTLNADPEKDENGLQPTVFQENQQNQRRRIATARTDEDIAKRISFAIIHRESQVEGDRFEANK